MNLNLPGNIVSINDVKERKMTRLSARMEPPTPPDDSKDWSEDIEAKGEYAISTRKLLLIIFIGLWVIDCLIAAWIIFHTVCG